MDQSKKSVKSEKAKSAAKDSVKVKSKKKSTRSRLPKDTIGVRKPHKFLNLPNGDIRHTIPKLFSEFLNNADPIGLRSFLATHCVPECDLIYRYDGEVNPSGDIYNKIEGVEKIVFLFESIFTSYPDYLFHVTNTQAQANPETKCGFVKSNFLVSYTKMVEGHIIQAPIHATMTEMARSSEVALKTVKATVHSSSAATSTRDSSVLLDDNLHLQVGEEELCDLQFDTIFREEGGGELWEEEEMAHIYQEGVSSSLESYPSGISGIISHEESAERAAQGGVSLVPVSISTVPTVFNSSHVKLERPGKLLAKPILCKTFGQFIQHLDAQSRITKFIFFYKSNESEAAFP